MKAAPALFGSLLLTLPSLVVAEKPATYESLAEPFLSNYCFDCHDGDTQKGDVALHELKTVTAENAELWKRIWEQVSLKEMPPRKKKHQPESAERLQLAQWITGQLETALADLGGFTSHHHPAKANHLPHELLFGELPKDLKPTSSPARIWRIHPQEHLVRLNALIDVEPEYDPTKPGQRTKGDHIPWNQLGEIKVYYGLDRLLGWVGGSAAYAAAITGFPPVLSTTNDHGLRNYPVMYSVNGSEATQIASHAEDILRFMAFGPEAEPYQYIEPGGKKTLPEKYKGVDIRGTIQSLYWNTETKRPLTPVYDLMKGDSVAPETLKAAVEFLFEALTLRPPTPKESAQYVSLAEQSIKDLGKRDGAILGLVPIFLDPNALFRPELAQSGEPDQHGRVKMEGWELALAINGAFSYLPPNNDLKKAVLAGQLESREDVAREVKRILNDESIRKPRVLQFFREYFDYDRAGRICKDSTALRQAGGDERNYYRAMFDMTASSDRLVELIVQQDKNVLRELLTTDRVVYDQGIDSLYYSTRENLKKPKPPAKGEKKNRRNNPALRGHTILPKGSPIHVRVVPLRYLAGKPRKTLTTLPKDQRLGILTHPSWLVSHSDAMDNHAIHRGKWIRERLLGDAVPDVPISVDAMLPDEPKTTLRHRMRVTRKEECWRCHQKMDPLGMPFEMYNHIGLNRLTEQGKPVDTSGEILHSGDSNLDGPVKDALEMIRRLAASERVEQVFVRHAFRYWMGRNETIDDAPVLQGAWKAYRDNEGSLKAMLTSLLTSDAFLYRTR